jgi:hypothetical protein
VGCDHTGGVVLEVNRINRQFLRFPYGTAIYCSLMQTSNIGTGCPLLQGEPATHLCHTSLCNRGRLRGAVRPLLPPLCAKHIEVGCGPYKYYTMP